MSRPDFAPTVARLWPRFSVARIAALIHREERTVLAVADRLGLPPKTDRADAEIRRRWATETARALAADLGMTEAAVRMRARHLLLPAKRRGPAPGGKRAPHGTRARQRDGCGCAPCELAARTYLRVARARLRGATVERLADGHVVVHPKPRGRACQWRCPCDAWRINTGDACGACGAAPPWAAEPRRPPPGHGGRDGE